MILFTSNKRTSSNGYTSIACLQIVNKSLVLYLFIYLFIYLFVFPMDYSCMQRKWHYLFGNFHTPQKVKMFENYKCKLFLNLDPDIGSEGDWRQENDIVS